MNNRIFVAAVFFLFVALAFVGGVIWALAARVHPDTGPALQAEFDQWQGADRDPVIQKFRDTGPAAVIFLARQMKSAASTDRAKAASVLRQMGTAFSGTDAGLAALVAALGPFDERTCSIAEGALGDLGPSARSAVPSLMTAVIRELGSWDPGAGLNGIWALGRIGPDARGALPLLAEVVREKRDRLQVYAAGAVLEIAGEDPVARKVIDRALQGPNLYMREDATNVLMDLKNPGLWKK